MITYADVVAARERLRGVAVHTPLIRSAALSTPETSVWFKPESLQPIGSFKLRGAYNRIAALSPEVRAAGVIAYSSGNHAQGVAYAARAFGIPALIVMPDDAPRVKIEATRVLGAEVVLYDPQTQKREDVAARLMHGQTLVPPFNDPYVMAGQGTIGLEIFDDLPEVDQVWVPIGGGGMISGVAAALRHLRPSVLIIGVEPELADDARRSKAAGQVVEITGAQASRTLADGVRTLAVGALTFEHIRAQVDAIVTVSEAQLREAARHLILSEKLVVEPTGALPLAAWRAHAGEFPNAKQVVHVISGGNIDPALLAELVQER